MVRTVGRLCAACSPPLMLPPLEGVTAPLLSDSRRTVPPPTTITGARPCCDVALSFGPPMLLAPCCAEDRAAF